jgi:hypothetical protein
MEAIFRLADRSAWGKWQLAMCAVQGSSNSEESRLRLSEQVFRQSAEDGVVSIRGRQKHSVNYEELSRDFWRVVYFDLQRDPHTLWRAALKVRLGATVKLPEYDDFIVDKQQFDAAWPERDLKYIWPTTKLKIRAFFRKMSDKPKKSEVLSAPEQTEEPVSVPAEIPAKPLVEVSVTDLAPPGWERLFAIGDDGHSVWLRFLPDTEKERPDALLLIVYGHKVLLGNSRIGIHAAHAAVRKTIDVSPTKAYHNQASPWAQLAAGLSVLSVMSEDFSAGLIGTYLRRVGLSQGGMYELTENGERRAASLANDLISRA